MNAHTVDPETLTKFKRDGFVAVPGFLTGTPLGELIAHVDQFVNEVVPTLPANQVFYDDKSDLASLKQIQQLGDHDPYFRQLLVASPFRTVAEALIGGPVEPKNLQYFNKPPRSSQPTPPHQDGFYFMLDPCSAVTLWFSLDDVDHENGCVRYVRGSHQDGMREHRRTNTLGFSQGVVDFPTASDIEREVAVPAHPGDLLAHHAMTLHHAAANQSANRSRRSLGFIYYDCRARQDEVAHAEYQRNLASELTQQGKL